MQPSSVSITARSTLSEEGVTTAGGGSFRAGPNLYNCGKVGPCPCGRARSRWQLAETSTNMLPAQCQQRRGRVG